MWKYLRQLGILAIMLLSLQACKDKASMLVKSWKLEDLKYNTTVPKEMQPAVDKSINDLKSDFVLTYNADGTYSTKMKDQVLEGKWKLNWNSSKIICETDRGETIEYNVLTLSEDKFEFEAMQGKDKAIFTMSAIK
jgi:hypothetical protein